MKFLRRRINCAKFLALIKNSIKAGYVYKSDFYVSDVGIFQRNATSFILNNIYLHELDIFMVLLAKSFKKGKTRRKIWKVDSKDPFDPNFRRLYYIRYVDDFVVSILGSRKDIVDIQTKISSFLLDEFKLNLHNEKMFITRFSKTATYFLGVFIKDN